MRKVLLAYVILCAPLFANADRTVKISLPSNAAKLNLSNPSTVSVSYDVVCYNAAGTQIYAPAAQTLAAGASKAHNAGKIDTGKCASDTTPDNGAGVVDAIGKKYYLCRGSSGTVNYANAENACGLGQKFCFPRPTSLNMNPGNCSQYWVKADADVKYSDGCSSYAALGGSDRPFIDGGYTSYEYLSVDNGATSWSGAGRSGTGTELKGATCCEDSEAAGVCKITIKGADGDAYLASPEFKGGSPF